MTAVKQQNLLFCQEHFALDRIMWCNGTIAAPTRSHCHHRGSAWPRPNIATALAIA